MHNSYIFNLRQPCNNRGIELVNNKDGSVSMDGQRLETIKECDEYLEKRSRTDFNVAATINDCRQFSEDGFESFQHVKRCDEDTTVGDLIKWQREKFPEKGAINSGVATGKTMIPIHLVVMD